MSSNAIEQTVTPSPACVEVTPLSIHTGAQIGGVDLSQPLPAEQVRDIRAALLKWKVIFFRDQPMTHRQHIDFARQFGEVTPGHVVYGSDGEFPEIYPISKHRTANHFHDQVLLRPWTGWHTDITGAINPPMASILRGVVVPPYGGDTQFTSLMAAYKALSPALKTFIDGLRGIHRNGSPQGVQADKEYQEKIRNRLLESEHPLVRVHPETGERALYAGPNHLQSIVGLKARESQALLELLWEHLVRPEFTVRFKWEPGSVAFWDNRAVCHLAPRDIFDSDFEREFYRTTLVGDVPVGVDGKPSISMSGDPIGAA
ncbi:MAG: alpha-ketoglutarate-dependent taurine dioxygenase [Gammaproteobacteria bacterium]|jgi:alpha-ketoglutarate-dependent taurine dioxygenase